MKTRADLEKIIESLNLPFEVAELQKQDAMDAYLAGRFGLFYDVGGGKTLVSTLIMLMFGLPSVVTMPHILLPQWKRWLKRARVPEDLVYIYYGPRRKEEKLKEAKWVLTSHAIFRMDIDKFMKSYRGRKVVLGVDEAQICKDPRTKTYQAVKSFVGVDNPLILMTATPTAKPQDTYSYMALKTPGLYRNMTHWEALHVGSKNIFKQITSYNNLDLLRENFAINAAKRDKEQLFGITTRPIIQQMEYDLSPKQKKLYKRMVEEQLLLLPDGTKIDASTPQRLRHALQQLVWNPQSFDPTIGEQASGFELLETICEQADFMHKEPNELEETDGSKKRKKFVVWTYYRSTTEAIYNWMRAKYGDTGALAYGGSDSAKAVEKIMFDDRCRWLVANPRSVGAGLELQFVCRHMFFAEMETTPIPTRQAIGRIDRPGQDSVPLIHIGTALDTVQVSLYQDLLRNDDTAAYIERTRNSLRMDLMGQNPDPVIV